METITTKTEDIKIAGELMMKHWKALKLNSDKNENWDKAFNFFEKRITTRYLNPIHEILNMDLNTGEGFAVVNLQCSLIETIESFHEGWIFHKNKYYHRIIKSVKDCLKDPMNSKESMKGNHVFESFFKKREPFKSCIPVIPNSFYSDVRCGLLHETQTKNEWVIKENKSINIFYEEKNGEKIIYRSNFQRAILEVMENYKKAIVEGIDEKSGERRENFKAKFDHICESLN